MYKKCYVFVQHAWEYEYHRGWSGMGMNISGDGWGWGKILRERVGMGTNIHPRASL